ncbi:hypothetical protein CLUG_03384 [Clavispora lusitaniae ATCC 42720]|uniref:Uncharacterized protein n=1 Tax=Clavispora lusitaniae (strain ATCC 42720) TaxID=306902 RepID=C4Y5F0_CLAL4|nr:uncharacterized protein CLUG_03384 [Clavispora lusitaniae ATCC 42720]EEQ39255.1 hypothetical protein CLUG_03384 [Clavispora lusitaniae ATCC 42720]
MSVGASSPTSCCLGTLRGGNIESPSPCAVESSGALPGALWPGSGNCSNCGTLRKDGERRGLGGRIGVRCGVRLLVPAGSSWPKVASSRRRRSAASSAGRVKGSKAAGATNWGRAAPTCRSPGVIAGSCKGVFCACLSRRRCVWYKCSLLYSFSFWPGKMGDWKDGARGPSAGVFCGKFRGGNALDVGAKSSTTNSMASKLKSASSVPVPRVEIWPPKCVPFPEMFSWETKLWSSWSSKNGSAKAGSGFGGSRTRGEYDDQSSIDDMEEAFKWALLVFQALL